MNNAQILIIDDDPDIRRLIRIHLQDVVMKIEEAKNGQEAIKQLRSERFDLMLLDLMMDDLNGLEILRFVRAKRIDIPVIVISAITEIDKKIEALGLGADDYVTKPFTPSELVARVLANIRRSRQTLTLFHQDRIHAGMMTLDMKAQTLEKNNVIFPLSQTECELLSVFMCHPGRTLTKEEIYQAVWKHDQFDANSLSVYINSLRKKIEDHPGSPRYIQTVRGIGYRFVEANL